MVGPMSAETPEDASSLAPRPGSLRARMADWRRWAPRAVFESVLIVFSVVLALGVTNWAEDRREQRRADQMRVFLRQEVASNRTLLLSNDYLPHHRRLQGELSRAATTGASSIEELRPVFRSVTASGVHFTPLDDSVWRSLAGSEVIEHMDPQEVFQLARLYRLQADLETLNTAFYSQMMSMPADLERGDPPRGALIRLNMYFNDVIAIEAGLADLYGGALATLDRPPGAAAPAAATRTDDVVPAKR